MLLSALALGGSPADGAGQGVIGGSWGGWFAVAQREKALEDPLQRLGVHGARPLYQTVQCRSMTANNNSCKEQT
jgi:hypothetical protein